MPFNSPCVHFYPRKGKHIIYAFTNWWKKKFFQIFHSFCFHSQTLLFCCSWLAQGSGVINNLFQAFLYFLTNSASDLAAPVKALIRNVSAYVSNCWCNLSLLREKSTRKDILSPTSTSAFCIASAKTVYSITCLQEEIVWRPDFIIIN